MVSSARVGIRRHCLRVLTLAYALMMAGCASHQLAAIKPVKEVYLPQFMGDWYVIACIPTVIETEAYNAIESYRLAADGSIKTTFVFREGGFAGPEKSYHPTGFVLPDTGNAVWDMQFIWPFTSEYIIAYLDPDYAQTIIARNDRDYVWIMAREPKMTKANYQALIRRVAALGYDVAKLREVPQRH